MRIGKLFKLLKSTTMRRVDAVYKTNGYNIVVDGRIFYRWEQNWHKANKITRQLRRRRINAEFRKVVVKEAVA